MARRLPQVLTRNEARALLATPNRYYPTGQRDLCMIKLMLNAGLRASEVLSLRWHDIDLHTGRLTVRAGKGNKDRQVWVGESTLDLMRAWRGRAPASPYCFPNAQRDPHSWPGPAGNAQAPGWQSRHCQRGAPAHAPAHLRHRALPGDQRHSAGAKSPGSRQSRHHHDLHPHRG